MPHTYPIVHLVKIEIIPQKIILLQTVSAVTYQNVQFLYQVYLKQISFTEGPWHMVLDLSGFDRC